MEKYLVQWIVEITLSILIFVLGLCLGSFVNMLWYRTAAGYGLIKSKRIKPWDSFKDCFVALAMTERSYCDFCGKQLHWWNNIPVVSWILAGGKSTCCHKKLPWVYPLLELNMGILLFFYYWLFFNKIALGLWVLGAVVLVFLVFSVLFDYLYMILPNFTTYFLIILAAASLIWRTDIVSGLLSGVGAFLFVWVLSKIKIKGKEAMGDGDAPLAGFMGLWLGFPGIIIAFYVAFIVGAIVGVALIYLRKKKGDDQIPFGPFLILGTMVAWWMGGMIVKFIILNF